MVAFSPIASTYGVRVEQLLETPQDFQRYHEKLNRKLQKLRHRCQVVNKDTRKYSANDKYSKISSTDYDKKNKLYGVLMLLHAERNLAMAETLKLKSLQRGKLKSNERKVLATRLKKAVSTADKLVELTRNEKQWITRVQYIAYARLALAEYLLIGKGTKFKDGVAISRNLGLCFATLSHLCDLGVLPTSVFELIQSKYEHSLKQYAGNIISSADLHNFIVNQVKEAQQAGDELSELLVGNGFKSELREVDTDQDASARTIQWRSFAARVHDSQVEQWMKEATQNTSPDVSNYDNALLKWQQALEKQEKRVAYYEDGNEDDDMSSLENEQILLAYIKYETLFTSILRDSYLFEQLWKQWNEMGASTTARITKYKEIERIVASLVKYLGDVMELPGVYSDAELMAHLQLCQLFFRLSLSSGCLGPMYQSKGKFLESLALHVDAYRKLQDALSDFAQISDSVLPAGLLTRDKIDGLQALIKRGWSSVLVLAEHEKSLHATPRGPYSPSLIDMIGSRNIKPSDVNLKNLFPMRPQIRPVQGKPTLFDLAFNYVNYEAEEPQPTERAAAELSFSQDTEQEQTASKKRGFLGLFGR
ncbi:hypothetical protein HG536_0A08400 [Torulaspora globosa]|uniref:Signal recognition particle subunit SRP68 n=1 Tax=Torulaspora globosa TaxID=48254 RepID=A0A7G3ZBY9_9SACH|nr:uncharacterized protein HG536_0A08400 [Torulaspora globosa]QLL31025.1 hypothetical protein HG536_0A08400 [Torulaspora globosa]